MAPTPAPIDPRGPRFNQAVLALSLFLGFLFGQWLVVPIFAIVLFLGAAFGSSYSPVLRLFQVAIRPRLQPPTELEDLRPPRFAASVGVAFLGSATVGFLFGSEIIGWGLALTVAALAALAAITGLCIGCEMYVWVVRFRGGVRIVHVEREAHNSNKLAERPNRKGAYPALPDDLRGNASWVVFTTEYCAVCPKVVEQIESERRGENVVTINVADRVDLASIYKVRRAPTVLRADDDGNVIVRLSGADAVKAELIALRNEDVIVH